MQDECLHEVVMRDYRLRDVARDVWRMLRGRPPLRPEECGGALICRQCGQQVKEGR